MAAFLKAGKVVLTPHGDSQRYDMVIDEGGKFIRIQCKTGRIVNGAIRFPTCSTNWLQKTSRNYRGQVEYFAVYCPELDKVYVVSVLDVGVKDAALRIDPTKQGQTKGIRWAKDFEFGPLTQLAE